MRNAVLGLPLALALVGAVTGCTGDPVPPPSSYAGEAATPRPDPEAGLPEEGVCRDLREVERGAASSNAPAVECDGPHTAYTFHVGRFEPDADDVDRELAARTCQRELRAVLGVRPALLEGTVLDTVWFRPSEDDWEKGGRWFRCDLVASDFDGDRLLPLPSGTPPFRPRLPDEVSRCIDEISDQEGRFVTCDRRHDYRWAGAAEARVDRRPAEARARELAEERCGRYVDEGAFWFTWPSQLAWSAGERTIHCYRADRG